MHPIALNISNFTKKYGSFTAVKNLSLQVKSGEIFGLLGPNGAGKSTTIQSICGISNFNEGLIEVFGHNVKTDPLEAKRRIGLSAQDYNVDMYSTVYNILDFVGGYYGLKGKDKKQRIHIILSQLNLLEHAKKPFNRLSGGMKRRVILARALICDPDLLILDEPTAALDVELRYELWDYIKTLNEKGKTIILTSHYIEEIERLCENVAVIHHGELLFQGHKKELLQDHPNLEKAYRLMVKKYEN